MLFEGTLHWLVVVIALVLWLPQNAAHEYAHVVAHRHWGALITAFVPWPTWKGGFTFAHMSYRQLKERPLEKTAEGVCSVAPQVVNTVVLSMVIALRWRFPEMPEILASILTAWALVNYVDGAVGLATFYRRSPKPSTDGWSLQRTWNLSPWTCRAVAASWHIWFGFFLLIPSSVL